MPGDILNESTQSDQKEEKNKRRANKMKCNRELESNRYLYVKVFAFRCQQYKENNEKRTCNTPHT